MEDGAGLMTFNVREAFTTLLVARFVLVELTDLNARNMRRGTKADLQGPILSHELTGFKSAVSMRAGTIIEP